MAMGGPISSLEISLLALPFHVRGSTGKNLPSLLFFATRQNNSDNKIICDELAVTEQSLSFFLDFYDVKNTSAWSTKSYGWLHWVLPFFWKDGQPSFTSRCAPNT